MMRMVDAGVLPVPLRTDLSVPTLAAPDAEDVCPGAAREGDQRG